MSMYKKMRDTSSPVFISLEIQKLANVISTSKILLKQRQNTRTRQAHGRHGMSSGAAYSARTFYITSDAELHILNKFKALKNSINCQKIQNEADFNDGMLPQRSPRAQRKRLRKFCVRI